MVTARTAHKVNDTVALDIPLRATEAVGKTRVFGRARLFPRMLRERGEVPSRPQEKGSTCPLIGVEKSLGRSPVDAASSGAERHEPLSWKPCGRLGENQRGRVG